ncbi:MAG: hypothetical protein KBS64_01865 [Treponema sp.]|nr:hypothetical protein [Candidatus Treponema equi]
MMLNKRSILLFFSAFLFISFVFPGDWVLAAKKFDFVQNKKRDLYEQEFSSLVPQMVLEQISEGLIRSTSEKEMMDRTLDTYLVERQSLFLNLAKENKVRDGLVLSNPTEKKFKKALAAQQKKIQEVEEKIDENLEKTRQIREEYQNSLVNEEKKNKTESDFNIFFNPLTNLFVKKTEKLLPDAEDEKVTLYKKDSSALYVPSENYKNNGPDSRAFEKEMVSAKINGFLDGTLTLYGDYFSVTCTLWLYPGRQVLGSITEVGKIRDCGTVASNIASYMAPLLANHMPVDIIFEVTPEEIVDKSSVTVDGIYYEKIPEKLVLDSGKHSIKVECKDYYSRMITYEFTGADKFVIQADMIKQENSELSVAILKPIKGTVYADGKFSGDILDGNIYGNFSADGSPVIGQFIAMDKDKKGNKQSFFYYVPEHLQQNGTVLAVNGTARDHESYVDKRRIWTYRAYTLLVLSMPFTLYSTGKYNSAVRAYNSKSFNDLDEVYRLQDRKNICLGITAACTGLFVIELVRYLIAANSVLPASVHKASSSEIHKAEEKQKKMYPVVETVLEQENDAADEQPDGDVEITEEKETSGEE